MTALYFLRPSFTVVKIVVSNFDNGLVEHFAEQAMKRCYCGSLCNFCVTSCIILYRLNDKFEIIFPTELLWLSIFRPFRYQVPQTCVINDVEITCLYMSSWLVEELRRRARTRRTITLMISEAPVL